MMSCLSKKMGASNSVTLKNTTYMPGWLKTWESAPLEPRKKNKKPPTFHYNWLFHRDPSNGVLQSLTDLDSIIRYMPQTTRVFFVTRMYVYIHLAGLTTNPLDTQ